MSHLLRELAEMHTYCRPHGSRTEAEFIRRYVSTLPYAHRDHCGNWHVEIGSSSTIFSCHTDTVHNTDGRQGVHQTGDRLHLTHRSRRHSDCLGADDTVGVFLCRQMVLAGIPGHYMFHYGEEAGCQGSRQYSEDCADLLAGYTSAIAFDRAGTSDVITHQIGNRTASDSFASALARHLNTTIEGFCYQPSALGLYTDTESYAQIVPECTNLSVGYFSNHRSDEYVDTRHVLNLLLALLSLDTSTLPIDRDPIEARLASELRINNWLRGSGYLEDEDEDSDELDTADLKYRLHPEDYREETEEEKIARVLRFVDEDR